MMSLAAKDAIHTSDLDSQDPPPTTGNITEQNFLQQLPPDVHFHTTFDTGTPRSVADAIEHPMDADNDHHHDQWQPVDLSTL